MQYKQVRGAALTELLVVLPLLLLILSGVTDFSRTLADKATILEVSRAVGRAVCRTWVIDETTIAKNAVKSATTYLKAAGYDPATFQTATRVLDLDLGGSRYTKGVEVRVTPAAGVRTHRFFPSLTGPSLVSTSFYRLENAEVEIRDVD